MRMTLLLMVLAVSWVPLDAGATGNVHARPQKLQKECLSPSKVQLKGDLRKLWIDHGIWTRNYIVSALAGLEDQEKTLNRLLRNQQDIGNAMKPYYGEEVGNKLAELLREHILIAGKLVDAAKNENLVEVEKANKEWYSNADVIAQFLSSANPNWSNKELQDLLHRDLQLITDKVSARLKKDWDADINAFDIGETHLILLADVLADGIIKQFPKLLK
ncbi:hypothetical protein D3C76_686260 [compost metagenome]